MWQLRPNEACEDGEAARSARPRTPSAATSAPNAPGRPTPSRPQTDPVWTAGYRHGGKAWHVLINAATGEVHGRRPYSAWKIFIAVTIAILVVAGIVAAIALNR